MAAEFNVVVRADNVNDLLWFRPWFLCEINSLELDEYEAANISIRVTEVQELLDFSDHKELCVD